MFEWALVMNRDSQWVPGTGKNQRPHLDSWLTTLPFCRGGEDWQHSMLKMRKAVIRVRTTPDLDP